MDAVRAGHLLCYGYNRPTTPHLEAPAADGLLFENALAAAPGRPSHASLFTGTYPSRHGVDVAGNLYLDGRFPTMATTPSRSSPIPT
jgi:arylsulfatase A-like enzyme